VVVGRTGTPESGAHGVTALLVPTDLPGLTRSRFDCLGQRAIGLGSLFFENVRVPVAHRLGEEHRGFVQVMQGFDFSRALIGLQVLAVARIALAETWTYVTERQASGNLRPPVTKRTEIGSTIAHLLRRTPRKLRAWRARRTAP